MDIPSLGDAAVVIGSSVIEINATVNHVWAVLTDFAQYGQWNPLCRAITVDGTLGGPVTMEVMDDLKGEVVVLNYQLDAFEVSRQIAWSAQFPEMGLVARRDQFLQPLDSDRCVYWTTDLYTGPSAAEQGQANGPWVRSAFDAMALGLKTRCEGSQTILSAQDRLAIQEVIGLYCEALDDKKLHLFDACLASDVKLSLNGTDFTRESYRTLCRKAELELIATQHQLAPSQLWRDTAHPDRVHARTTFIANHVHPSSLMEPVAVGGTYRDILERLPEGWRIIARSAEPSWSSGNTSLLDFSGIAP